MGLGLKNEGLMNWTYLEQGVEEVEERVVPFLSVKQQQHLS